jgi:hypothetical protein
LQSAHRAAEALLNTTIKKGDSRFGGKDGEIAIVTPDGNSFSIHFDLRSLALTYVSFQMLPQNFMSQSRSHYCPFCMEAFGKSGRD